MPTYDYRCLNCGHTVELVHSILEDGPEACEECGGPVHRVAQPTGVIFRGSGFYVTDSRSSSKPSTEKGGDSSTPKEKGGDSSTPKEKSGGSSTPTGSGGPGTTD